MTHVFIVGSKGIPAHYGGFESFVENLTARKKSKNIKYHVSCMNNEKKHFEYNDADCFNVRLPLPGAPGRIMHVGIVLYNIEKWIKKNPNEEVIIYILGCRIGPLLIPHSFVLHKHGAKIYCNPDGLEWKRDKWNRISKVFLKYCESCLVRYSDLVICDSKTIEEYILNNYKRVKTIYISYGVDIKRSECSEDELQDWYKKYNISKKNYFLIVGRFVPENNYETIIYEFMKSNTNKDLVIVSNFETNKFYKELLVKTNFNEDKRIKFVGTVYNQELLKKIREEAFAYIHGHSVGGTNPSLLEALCSTNKNLLFDVDFNREVAEDTAYYWRKENNDLKNQIDLLDNGESELLIDKKSNINSLSLVKKKYAWDKICSYYEDLFLGLNKEADL